MATNSPPAPSKSRGGALQTVKDYRLGLASVALLIVLTGLALTLDANGDFLYRQNEALEFALAVAALVIASEIGFRIAQRERVHLKKTARAGHANEIQAAMFAILGLLLAFTVSMAVSRFDGRKAALVEETNAIGTAYLRAQTLPQPQRATEMTLIRRYTDARLASARPGWNTDVALQRETSDLQQRIWEQAAIVSERNPQSLPASLFVESVNSMIDAEGARDAARLNTVPGSVIYLLFTASLVAMGVLGYRAGLENDRSALSMALLALVVALILLLILDLQRPYEGLVTISQQILVQLRQSMGP